MRTIQKRILATIIIFTLGVLALSESPFLNKMQIVEAAKVKINTKSATICKDEVIKLKVSGTKKKIKWSSSNQKVARVNAKGVVTGIKKGKATITARYGNKKLKCKITVLKVTEIDKQIKKIIKSEINSQMSQAQKVRAIHDYLILNSSYDLKGKNSHNERGILLDKKGACQSYMIAFQLLMEELKIPSTCVVYIEGNHGWNMVKLDGKWFHVDVTMDQSSNDEKKSGYVSYRYFLKRDNEMTQGAHIGFNKKKQYPRCNTSSEKYFKEFAKVCTSKEQIEKLVKENYKDGLLRLEIMTPKTTSNNDIYDIFNQFISVSWSGRLDSFEMDNYNYYNIYIKKI